MLPKHKILKSLKINNRKYMFISECEFMSVESLPRFFVEIKIYWHKYRHVNDEK